MGKKKGGDGGGSAVENLKQYRDGNSVDLSHQDRDEAPVAALAANLLLTKVDLSGNSITTLPQGFGQLLHIVHLNLSKNGLTELPEAFGKLESIRWLDLFSNNLTRLPYSFGNLKQLRWLDLKGNSIVEGFLSADVIGPCANDTECKACAKGVLARVSDLAEKRKKNDERLDRKKQRELEEQRVVEKEHKASEKAKRKEEWLRAQDEKSTERQAELEAFRGLLKSAEKESVEDTPVEVAVQETSLLKMLSPIDSRCHLTWCGSVVVLLLLPMLLLIFVGAHQKP